ncbi:MAG: MFS transporter [Calditrichaeota bacterium]|nr:MAG: MFS transporter [Calditrichota bacterium]
MAFWLLKLSYVLHFIYLGTMVAFVPLYLKYLGLSAQQIGTLYAIMALARIMSGLAIGYFSDRFQMRHHFLSATATGTALALTAFAWAKSFSAFIMIFFFIGIFVGPIIPILDATTLDFLSDRFLNYGKIRLYGTLSFGITSLGMGMLIQARGTRVVVFALIAAYWSFAALSYFLPGSQVREKIEVSLRDVRRAFAAREIRLTFVTSFFFSLAFACYNVFFSIYLKSLSLAETTIGLSWLISTLAEAVFFFLASHYLRRFQATTILLLAYAVTGFRWIGMGYAHSAAAIYLLQGLHAISFGGFYAALINFIREHFPPELLTTAQSLFLIVNFGLASIIGAPVAGFLFTQFGGSTAFILSGVASLVVAGLYAWRGNFGPSGTRG